MKKVFTLAFTLFAATTMFAQEEINKTFEFVNSNDEIVADGETITIKEAVDERGIKMFTGLFVKNMTDAVAHCRIECEIKEIPNGSFGVCMLGSCVPADKVGTIETQIGDIKAGAKSDLQSEWEPTAYGKATVTYQIKVYDLGINGNYIFPEVNGYGPKVTVNFVYDETSTGINDVTVPSSEKEVARYGLDGSRLAQPAKGINLVKTADGKVRKVLVK